MTLEIKIETIEASGDRVQLKGWDKNRTGYSILSLPPTVNIPKLNSVMILNIEFVAPETKFESELVTTPVKL